MKVILNIRSNEGYSADQVESRLSVGELKDALEEFDDDAEVIVFNESNRYGANYGILTGRLDVDYSDDEEEEEQ